MKMLKVGIERVAIPVFPLNAQRVVFAMAELVHCLVPQPVLPRWVSEALRGRGRIEWTECPTWRPGSWVRS